MHCPGPKLLKYSTHWIAWTKKMFRCDVLLTEFYLSYLLTHYPLHHIQTWFHQRKASIIQQKTLECFIVQVRCENFITLAVIPPVWGISWGWDVTMQPHPCLNYWSLRFNVSFTNGKSTARGWKLNMGTWNYLWHFIFLFFLCKLKSIWLFTITIYLEDVLEIHLKL